MKRVLRDIAAERRRQDEKWGVQHHKAVEWLAILAEEFGEASKEVNEWHFRPSMLAWMNLRAELVQTAAVAVAMVEDMDRTERKINV